MFDVFIEIPKGSKNKYEHCKNTNQIRLDRPLFSAVHYPSDYGYIIDSLGQDGDPLDALVLLEEPTFPGCVVEARPIGVFKMEDDKGIDDKIISVSTSDPFRAHVNSLQDLGAHYLKEIEHFFSVYKDLEQKTVKIIGWGNKEDALKIIDDSFKRYKETLGD